jgi:hypothetical protein
MFSQNLKSLTLTKYRMQGNSRRREYTASTNQLFTTPIGINEDTESENTFAHH